MEMEAWWVGAGGLALVLVLIFGAWLVTVIVRRSNDRSTEDTAPLDLTEPEPTEPELTQTEEPPRGD